MSVNVVSRVLNFHFFVLAVVAVVVVGARAPFAHRITTHIAHALWSKCAREYDGNMLFAFSAYSAAHRPVISRLYLS